MQRLNTKSTFKSYPITWILISINLFMFILETAFGGSNSKSTLCLLGANCDIDISQGEKIQFQPKLFTQLIASSTCPWLQGLQEN